MRVVIAGGAGFLGSHLSDRMIGRGHSVVCLDDLSTGRMQNVEHLLSHSAFSFDRCDISGGVEVAGTVDAVINLASAASPPDYHRMPLETLRVGSAGTEALLKLSVAKGARFVMASTSEIYGDPLEHPQRESYWGNVNSIGPRSVYDEAKRYAEALTAAYVRTEGLNGAIARIFNTYGPRMRAFDGRVVSTFIRQALRGEPLTIFGDGSQTRSFCYVSDLVAGLDAMLTSQDPGPINLGNPVERTVTELAELVIAATNSSSTIDYLPLPTDDPTRRRPDIGRATAALQWVPEVDFDEGLAATIDWFRHDTADLDGPLWGDLDGEAEELGRIVERPVVSPVDNPLAVASGLKVTVIGTGYLGAVHAAGMAMVGHDVLGVDTDAHKIAALQAGETPFYEPGFAELLAEAIASGRLRFTTSFEEAAEFGDVHFVCVGTPQVPGSDRADVSHLDAAVTRLVSLTRRDCVIIGKSTVPVGTAVRLTRIVADHGAPGVDIRLAWNPEFLRESMAVKDTLAPDRIVFGVADAESERVMRAVYAPVLAAGTPLIVTNLATAELIKVAANSFLATKISFINLMAEVCEHADADVVTLADAIGHDARIGRAFLNAGLGFGGGCLSKDIRAFSARSAELGVSGVPDLLGVVDDVNLRRRRRVVELATQLVGGDIAGRRVAVLGAAFKPGTDDIRNSPALFVALALAQAGAEVRVHDPQALDNVANAAPELHGCADIDAAVEQADIVLHLTEWEDYGRLDPALIAGLVRSPIVLDARNCLDIEHWTRGGWEVHSLGHTNIRTPAAFAS
ncbi:nucleotide sugar dehydrogenase [Allobranchiibius sp. CTAmp26]|uniref:nucleotide sugar dehydrogenase n=1 Tax=Allobranchiibius sp. CTAmp26 TaxID=2815214 RepID=UPI001AA10634|nr:nucleotide sugar dehydrogenase [Allobranchiibius sp. CTAmp26]MBO1753709.1 nucleotide sugar dehydrogenase [Allobranchiibius sp. CTAmp26]